jgi:Kef-type K+ transport system membrane component KefB
MEAFEFIRSHALALSPLAKFALGMAIIFGIPFLSRRVRLPAVVGLLLCGVLLGPHVFDLFDKERPVADFFAGLGVLLLMFFAGLEIDLALFRRSQRRSIMFGLITTSLPLLLGAAVGLVFGYGVIPAIVVGSLLASHTLLGLPIVTQLGVNRSEPVTITVGATVLSDTLSLVVFAMCVSTYQRGFSISNLAVQLIEIIAIVLLLLFGLGRAGRYILKRVGDDEQAYFILMFGIMAVAAVLVQTIHLPAIVGAFLAGLAVNATVQHKPAKEKLEFFGNSFFIPIFFVVTGFLIDPIVFVRSIIDNFALVAAIILALIIGKGIAAEVAGRAFNYTSAARMTVWSLTLPQVAATLAATLVGFNTFNPAGERLIDERVLDAVFVLMLTTSTLGPIMTQHYAPLMPESQPSRSPEPEALKDTPGVRRGFEI